MKKILTLSLMIVFLLFDVTLAKNPPKKKAPTHRFGLYGGVMLSQGEFSSTKGSKAGFANNGIGLMAEFVQYTKYHINWISSVSFTNNSFKAGAFQDQHSEYGITADNYFTTWIMTGISHSHSFGPMLSIYGLIQGGLLLSKYPNIYYAITQGDFKEYKEEMSLGKAFAYGIGGGVRYTFINLGVRYYMAYPEYQQTSPFHQGTVSKNLPAKILQVVFGINF